MTTIIDYGLGNVSAFLNVFHRLNIPVAVARATTDLANAERIILPGVGHFDQAMTLLDRSGMREALDKLVLDDGVPVLGVCVGMQMLAQSSEEGQREGLGWIDGRVERIGRTGTAERLPLPHMGWNDVEPSRSNALFLHTAHAPRFYFLHSFVLRCADAAHVLATTTYGEAFCCAVNASNVYGVQFHPEKSHEAGTSLLRGFAGISRA